ncbi:hypothetical protein BV898_05079 [Hypsibius exemplaris]|uniref:Uncharacterized protein n=1 Tax=Hypsibius exemplaris TaxID=2072580 RepID=A0A1W0X0M0_HYPEX|nr:hypothetical protein BV898_05079 [Hypsibius exemplaris]
MQRPKRRRSSALDTRIFGLDTDAPMLHPRGIVRSRRTLVYLFRIVWSCEFLLFLVIAGGLFFIFVYDSRLAEARERQNAAVRNLDNVQRAMMKAPAFDDVKVVKARQREDQRIRLYRAERKAFLKQFGFEEEPYQAPLPDLAYEAMF